MDIISVDGLTKSFGELVAVDGVSFQIPEGEIFGFLGPNGAGKTTTIKMLCTLLRPSGGLARVAGHDVVSEQLRVREAIGIIFQDPSLDERLTARENLDFHARIYGVPSSERKERIDAVLEMVELLDRKNQLVKVFSGGMKRRLEIARGLLHAPRVLFLDEPTLGLDPQTRQHIWDYLRELRDKQGVTLFLTTHYMDEAENCDRIAIIDNGSIEALDDPAGLKHMVGGDIVTLVSGESQRVSEELSRRYSLEPSVQNGVVTFEVDDAEAFLPGFLKELPLELDSVNLRRPTLDDVFLQLTGKAIRDSEIGARDQMRQHVRAWRGRRR